LIEIKGRIKDTTRKPEKSNEITDGISSPNLSVYTDGINPSVITLVYNDGIFPLVYTDDFADKVYSSSGIYATAW